MPIRSPQDLLTYELETIEDAETKAAEALPEMAKAADGQLRSMIDTRLKQGERVLKDVQKGLEKLDGRGRKTQNAAADGLIRETNRLLKEIEDPEMQKAVIIAGLQKLELYCIAAWGTVKAMAQLTGDSELANAMERAVREGYEWDEKMTQLAESKVNPAALQKGE